MTTQRTNDPSLSLTITTFRMPIHPVSRRDWPWLPASVQMPDTPAVRARALSNHDQTLERLRERSGVSPEELIAIVEDRPWPWKPMASADVEAWMVRHGFMQARP